MNVLNRKMFANRDARRKLANMGGIISSGPELMEVAQKYAPGGVVEPQQVFQPRSGLGSNIEYTYVDFLRENGLRDSPEARRMFVRYQEYMASQLESGQLADPRITQPFLDRPPSQPPTPRKTMSDFSMYDAPITAPDMPAMGSGIEALRKDTPYPSSAMMASVPATQASATDPEVLAAARAYGPQISISEDPSIPEMSDTRLEAERRSRQRVLPELGMDVLEGVTGAVRGTGSYLTEKLGEGASSLGFPDVGSALVEQSQRIDEISEQRAEDEAAREAAIAESVAEVEAEQALRARRPGPSKRGRPAKVLEAEKDFISNIPDDGLRGGDSLITEVEKTTTETGGDAEAVADTVLTNAGVDTKDLSIKEKATKYKELFSDLFGDSEAEKQELFWLNMAMIGFGIAAGESPSALKNISGGLLAGASEMQKQRATAREREDKLTMLGVETALAEEAEDRRTAALLDKEARDEAKQLRVYRKKLELKQQFDPTSPTGLYLGSEIGELVSGIYSDVLTDETLNADEKGAEFIKRAGPENVQKFYTLTGIPPLTTGNQGGGEGASWVDD